MPGISRGLQSGRGAMLGSSPDMKKPPMERRQGELQPILRSSSLRSPATTMERGLIHRTQPPPGERHRTILLLPAQPPNVLYLVGALSV
jgi:hypothetical protein